MTTVFLVGRCGVRQPTDPAGMDPVDTVELPGLLATSLLGVGKGGNLLLRVEDQLLQWRTLTGLPPIPGHQLRALVARQPGRFFRCTNHSVVTDARWAHGRVRGVARLVAAELTLVEGLVGAAAGVGWRVRGITDASGLFDLAPPGHRLVRRAGQLRRLRAVALGTGILWSAALGLHLGRLVALDAALGRRVSELEAPAGKVRSVRHGIEGMERALRTLDSTAAARDGLLANLAATMTRLPDSSFVSSLVASDTAAIDVHGAALDRRAVERGLLRVKGHHSLVVMAERGVSVRAHGARWERFRVGGAGGVAQ